MNKHTQNLMNAFNLDRYQDATWLADVEAFAGNQVYTKMEELGLVSDWRELDETKEQEEAYIAMLYQVVDVVKFFTIACP